MNATARRPLRFRARVERALFSRPDLDRVVDIHPIGAAPTRPTLAADAALEPAGLFDDDGCPKGDPDCLGRNGDCHDACESEVA